MSHKPAHPPCPNPPPSAHVQAADDATLSWLDGQALVLLRERARLQKELEKYRPVSRRLTVGGWGFVVGALWLVVGGWWLVVGALWLGL